MTQFDTALLIGGQFQPGQDADEPILNPRTGGLILNVAEASTGQVDAAVAAARRAFDGWSRTTPAERSAALLRIADRIELDSQAKRDLRVELERLRGSLRSLSTEEQIQAFYDLLESRGVDVSVRRSRGRDAGAACGQLALKRPGAVGGQGSGAA